MYRNIYVSLLQRSQVFFVQVIILHLKEDICQAQHNRCNREVYPMSSNGIREKVNFGINLIISVYFLTVEELFHYDCILNKKPELRPAMELIHLHFVREMI